MAQNATNGLWNNLNMLSPINVLLASNNTNRTNGAINPINNRFATPFLQTGTMTTTPSGNGHVNMNVDTVNNNNNNNVEIIQSTNINSNSSTPTPTGSIPISSKNSYKYALPNNLKKYTHSNLKKNDSKSMIIQCPNPTHNPILNHQKQEEIALSKAKQIQNDEYIDDLESKLNEQQKLIQSLISQNQILQSQLIQHKNQISMLSTQNNTLLSAYNTLQSQWKSSVLPSLSNSNSNSCSKTITHGHGHNAATNTMINGGAGSATNPGKGCGKWSVNDVMGWIGNIANGNFNKYAYLFCLNNIDGVQLINMTRMDLEKMGIKDNKDQIVLLEHVERLKRLSSSSLLLQCSTNSPAMN